MSNLNLGLGTSSSSSSICRYKGVVALPNGHWGAQIYANLQRVWLGTFKTERDAAMAYDSAAVKLGCSESHRNVPITPDHLAIEMDFQSHFSDEAVLIMIKDGSYPSKLGDFCRSWRDQAGLLNHHYPGGVMRIGGGEEILYKDCFEKVLTPSDIGKLNRLVIPKKYAVKFFPQVSHHYTGGVMRLGGGNDILYKDYFEKELTPSDVGKLNRLVIPKKYAVKFFPHVERPDASVNGGETADADLDFFDRTMKRWTFRYCSWKSSQSFVFTKGWNKFVKEKGLKTKDVVIFYSCEMKPTPGNLDKVTPFTMIDFRQCGPDGAGADEAEEGGEMNQGQGENVEMVRENAQLPVLRLFGVDIIIKDQTN